MKEFTINTIGSILGALLFIWIFSGCADTGVVYYEPTPAYTYYRPYVYPAYTYHRAYYGGGYSHGHCHNHR